MEYITGGKAFRYVKNALNDSADRDSYFDLAKRVFGLDFAPWYKSGYCGDNFIPYTLYDNDIVAASVGIVTGKFRWRNSIKEYYQISTVMANPKYRGMNLSRWLIESVLSEWKSKSDLIYLYANDSVVDFYQKFGFFKVQEYIYSLSVPKCAGKYRKLDINDSGDRAIFIEKYQIYNNPFSALAIEDNLSNIMFHCITFLYDNIYYVEDFDAVVIAECENNVVFCYDIYVGADCRMSDIIGVLADKDNVSVTFGFSPNTSDDFLCAKSKGQNTTVFALSGMDDSIFLDYKITFPYLSRA